MGLMKMGIMKMGMTSGGIIKMGIMKMGMTSRGIINGFKKDGKKDKKFNGWGYNINGVDRQGFNRDGYNINGFNAQGLNKDRYNINGYNISGYNSQGYNINGYRHNGLDRQGNKRKALKKNIPGLGLKILTPQKMLARLPISLAQLRAGNNSQKLKNEIRQLLYSLYRSKKISKTVYKNLITTI